MEESSGCIERKASSMGLCILLLFVQPSNVDKMPVTAMSRQALEADAESLTMQIVQGKHLQLHIVYTACLTMMKLLIELELEFNHL